MKFIPLTLCIILILSGAYASRKYQKETVSTPEEKVLSEKEETKDPLPTNTPTTSQSPTKIPTPSPTAQSTNASLSEFKYPGSQVTASSQNTLSLLTSDDPEKVTTWYQEKLESLGYSAVSRVRTNANNSIENRISVGNEKTEIEVKISKEPQDNSTKIFVEF